MTDIQGEKFLEYYINNKNKVFRSNLAQDHIQYLVNNLHSKFENFYYMLYGKEISYFTLFKINESKYFGKEVIECLKDVGYIKAIDLTDTGDAIECWVENEQGPTCLYLFPYDAGVVQVGE